MWVLDSFVKSRDRNRCFLSEYSKVMQNYCQVGLNSGLQKLSLDSNLFPGEFSWESEQETSAVPRLVSRGQRRIKRRRKRRRRNFYWALALCQALSHSIFLTTLRNPLLLFPLYRWENSESLGNLAKTTEPVCVPAGFRSQAFWLKSHWLSHGPILTLNKQLNYLNTI